MKQRKTVEDYLKAVYLLQKQNGSVRGADIAAELHVSRPTVSVSLKELEKEGLLQVGRGRGGSRITEKGLKKLEKQKRSFESIKKRSQPIR